MMTRTSQDLTEKWARQRKERDGHRAILARSPRLAKIARRLAVRLVWPGHSPCYKTPHDCCSYCDHQDEIAAAMVQVARSHGRYVLRGHVFDHEVEAIIRAKDGGAKK